MAEMEQAVFSWSGYQQFPYNNFRYFPQYLGFENDPLWYFPFYIMFCLWSLKTSLGFKANKSTEFKSKFSFHPYNLNYIFYSIPTGILYLFFKLQCNLFLLHKFVMFSFYLHSSFPPYSIIPNLQPFSVTEILWPKMGSCAALWRLIRF